MILYVSGSLFESPAQVLVNTVNTVGVMGKGVALQFRKLYPEMFAEYQRLCEAGQIDIGKLWLYKSEHKWVLNFPTKRHWRQPSRIEYIEEGLRAFARDYSRLGIHSIAFPPLGCGNGRLDFTTQVQPLMRQYLAVLPIEVFIYPSAVDTELAEHEQPQAMRDWLRTAPRSLPFSEVWEDILGVLGAKERFATYGKGSNYRVRLSDDGDRLDIYIDVESRRFVSKEALLSLWQQLRDHGFVMSTTVSGIDSSVWYHVVPVLAELPYVRPVSIASDYNRFEGNPVLGLQVLPSAFHRAKDVEQLELFA